MTCSGTASLEIAKRLIPQITIYKLNFFTELLFSLFVKVKYANIINIINKKMIICEVVNHKLNKKTLLKLFKSLLSDEKLRNKQVLQIKESLHLLESNVDPYSLCESRINNIIYSTTN